MLGGFLLEEHSLVTKSARRLQEHCPEGIRDLADDIEPWEGWESDHCDWAEVAMPAMAAGMILGDLSVVRAAVASSWPKHEPEPLRDMINDPPIHGMWQAGSLLINRPISQAYLDNVLNGRAKRPKLHLAVTNAILAGDEKKTQAGIRKIVSDQRRYCEKGAYGRPAECRIAMDATVLAIAAIDRGMTLSFSQRVGDHLLLPD